MKTNISTDTNQSARLLACGVDPKTADMFWCNFLHCKPFLALGEIPRDNEAGNVLDDKDVPAWSLSALISLLPSKIEEDNDPYDEIGRYSFFVYPYQQGWQVEYLYSDNDECHSLICIYDTTLIEICVQMIEWLTANGYSLNKTEE